MNNVNKVTTSRMTNMATSRITRHYGREEREDDLAYARGE